jgi:hypothetical protein
MFPSIRKLKNDVYDGGRVDWRSAALGRAEADGLCGADGIFVQTVAQAPDHAHHARLAGDGK